MKESCWRNNFEPRMLIFKALACKHRMDILEILRDGPKNVQEIASKLVIDISVVSRHLAILRNAQLIESKKEGQNVYYSIRDPRVFEIINIATQILRDFYIELSKRVK